MSIAAPATFTITGGATLTISVTWSVAPVTSTMVINGHTYPLNAVFDNPANVIADIEIAASCSPYFAGKVLQALQTVIGAYDIQANQAQGLPLSFAIA